MFRVASLAVLMVLSAVLTSTPGRAEPNAAPTSPQAEPVGYKAAASSGVEEFAHGNFAEAREHFARAHALFPNARTLRGLGMSEFELRNYVDAVDKLEQALASDQRRLEGNLRDETVTLLSRARAYVGEVYLKVTPATAEVHLDGIPVEVASTGRLRVGVGDHVLDFASAGMLSERRMIKLRGEQTMELKVTLQAPQTGQMRGSVADTRPATHTPIYKRWWLWTGIGVAVAGGVAAGIALSMRGKRSGRPNGGSTGDTLFFE